MCPVPDHLRVVGRQSGALGHHSAVLQDVEDSLWLDTYSLEGWGEGKMGEKAGVWGKGHEGMGEGRRVKESAGGWGRGYQGG